MVREPVQLAAPGPGAREGVAERRGEVGEDLRAGLGGRVREVGEEGTPLTSGCASSAGPAPRAAASAARTSGSRSSVVTADRETTPDAVPCAPSTVAMTVRVRPGSPRSW